MRGLQATYPGKDLNTSKESYKICFEGSMEVNMLYKEFTDTSAAGSEMLPYLETLLKLLYIEKFDIC